MRTASTDRVAEAKAALAQGIAALQSGDDWARVLNGMALRGQLHIGRLSFRNQLILMMQRPGEEYAATFAGWQKYGRQVLKGQKAAWILQPHTFKFTKKSKGEDGAVTEQEHRGLTFRAMPIFSLSQTDGEHLPEGVPTARIEGEVFEGSVQALRNAAGALSSGVVSGIEVRPRQAGDHTEADGWFRRGDRSIVVISDDRTQGEQFRTLAHELAHAILHGDEDHHSRPHREVEAESVSYVVCRALGLDTAGYSFPYVASWAGKADAASLIQQVGDRIGRAAHAILDALDAAREDAPPVAVVEADDSAVEAA